MQDAFARLESKDPIAFVRPGDENGICITLPVTDMREMLGVFQLSLAFAQVAKYQYAGKSVLEPPPNLLKTAFFLRGPGSRIRALMQAQHVGLIPFGIDRHANHRLYAESRSRLGRQGMF